MSEKLTLLESIVLAEARNSDLDYKEKKVKTILDRVTVELEGSESGVFSRLASRYFRLEKAIKIMSEKRNEINEQIKEKVESYFDAEDVVLTRVVDTVSFTMTVSKKSKKDDKVVVDYEAIVVELEKLIPKELEEQVKAITATYTKIIAQEDKQPALRVTTKLEEGLSDKFAKFMKIFENWKKKIASWAVSYDKKLNELKKQAKM